jgi:hypothetical protein
VAKSTSCDVSPDLKNSNAAAFCNGSDSYDASIVAAICALRRVSLSSPPMTFNMQGGSGSSRL